MTPSAAKRILPLGLAVALSLFGDLSLFAGLVTQLETVHLSLGEVGVLLSVHRLVRIPGNLVVGSLQDRLGRRPLFLLGMLLAVLSTAAYGLLTGFWPFLLARLAWGAAWALINVCGTTIVLDLSSESDRGSLSGLYNTWIWVGYAVGPLAGSLLTDALSFQVSMLICAAVTAVGLGFALWGVPETISPQSHGEKDLRFSIFEFRLNKIENLKSKIENSLRAFAKHFVKAVVNIYPILLIFMVVQFAGDGVMLATLTLLLTQRLGTAISLGGSILSAVAAGGIFVSGRAVLAGLASMGAGRLSDGRSGRMLLLALGLTAGAASFGVLALANSFELLALGLALNALGSGAAGAILPALVRDRSGAQNLGRAMGAFAMAGDVGSTLGPLLAFALTGTLGLAGVYALCLALLGACALNGMAGLARPLRRPQKLL